MKFQKLRLGRLLCALVFCLSSLCATAAGAARDDSEQARLDRGDVVVDSQKIDGVTYVCAKEIINEAPSRVWPIMTNPFEFEGKISPRMKSVEVLVDKPDYSLLKCDINIGVLFFIPSISYTVESKYDAGERITFKRIAGDLRDFRGFWQVRPVNGGKKTELTYSMYIDPGFPVPQWIIREGVKMELPRTLVALRQRVKDIYTAKLAPEQRSILASGVVAHTSWLAPQP
jgi:hypothetical protein